MRLLCFCFFLDELLHLSDNFSLYELEEECHHICRHNRAGVYMECVSQFCFATIHGGKVPRAINMFEVAVELFPNEAIRTV